MNISILEELHCKAITPPTIVDLHFSKKHVCGTPTVCKSVASAASDKVNHT